MPRFGFQATAFGLTRTWPITPELSEIVKSWLCGALNFLTFRADAAAFCLAADFAVVLGAVFGFAAAFLAGAFAAALGLAVAAGLAVTLGFVGALAVAASFVLAFAITLGLSADFAFAGAFFFVAAFVFVVIFLLRVKNVRAIEGCFPNVFLTFGHLVTNCGKLVAHT